VSLPASPNRALGASGEDLAAAWYEARGFAVLARNWRCREGELDLVVGQGRLYVFCEVKARTSEVFGGPLEAVTHDKQQRLRRLAARWLEDAAPALAREIRFDVAAVLDGAVEVVEGAF
jgi:putative endonuclease